MREKQFMGTNKEVAENWIDYAETDLEAAKILFAKGEFFFHVAMFHAHEAAEKSIKAILIIEEIKFPKTHDLDQLLSLLEEQKTIDANLYTLISPLQEFTVEVRYPNDDILITDRDIQHAINSSSEILALAKKKINSK